MTNLSTDEILNRLSFKFSRIVYDREFVACVNEDLQTIIDDKNKCCVLVFPTLSPNYLRVVKYQAKLCDLAVISLGSGGAKSVGVCLKKYFLSHITSEEECKKKSPDKNQMAEKVVKKIRPPLQLYVPPAQRKSKLVTSALNEENVKSGKVRKEKKPQQQIKEHCYCKDDVDLCFYTKKLQVPCCQCTYANIQRIKHSFHWIHDLQGQTIQLQYFNVEQERVLSQAGNIITHSLPAKILIPDFFNCNLAQNMNSQLDCLCKDKLFLYLPLFKHYSYLSVPDFLEGHNHKPNLDENFQLQEEHDLDSQNRYPELKLEDFNLIATVAKDVQQLEQVTLCDNKTKDGCAKTGALSDRVIVFEDEIERPKLKKSQSKDEHEQEKDIMRKAKQNINRKTRPIIKYVGDDNDTLNIGKGDNVNNWEELFNEDGELQDDIFTEIKQKVGSEVTIIKASEDYSAYASKQMEELEHMVELYDFPSTFVTHDIISAFSDIKSDSMYIKWVDDTHALLVLGSHSQAQRALELSTSLIKVRPMSAASSLALEKANQCDLRPAMKRPQTNLQTARRLITSHLGAKSRVSKEQNAKEREDLRIAKELKRQAKQNEKDAWEGKLRSAIN